MAIAWVRAVRDQDLRTHVGHFAGLMGVFVPISCSFILLTLISAITGLALIAAMLFVLVLAGLVVGLQLEVSNIRQSTQQIEATRLITSLAIAAVIVHISGSI